MSFKTTTKNPGHIHSLAKAYLDLLGRGGAGDEQPLLYRDDRQVYGLVVRCEHGSEEPSITVTACSLGDFRADLRDAVASLDHRGLEVQRKRFTASTEELDRWDWLADRSREDLLRVYGERGLRLLDAEREALLQRHLLQKSTHSFRELAALLRAPQPDGLDSERLQSVVASLHEKRLATTPLRVILPELPASPGASGEYRINALDALKRFRDSYRALQLPVRVPLGLEVLVKHPLRADGRNAHDLDNVLRRYLIPGIVETFRPPADYLTARHRIEGREDHARASSDVLSRAPASAAVGLIRMEAWRVIRAPTDRESGFVSVALFADDFGYGDSISAVEHAADDYNGY